ncbi:hypothetical protein [Peribacillus sp. YIM B13482]|uniref:hypothetical protein n=1 Tax=Peribacillus sp. YIM B13482 TaxID=3366298 RepID=UPI00366F04CC
MVRKNNEKIIYLVTNADKKAPLISLCSLPAKCPACHLFQEPKPLSFQLNENADVKVLFSCVNERCKSSFSAFYIKSSYVNEQYHFICFL